MTAFLLMTALMLSATACGAAPTTTEGGTLAPITTTTPTIPDPEPEPTEVSVNDSFTVIYPTNATIAEKSAAEAVVNAFTRLGITLTPKDDSTPQAKNEILIGKTNRNASQKILSGLSNGDFSLTVNGTKADGYQIILAANDDSGMELCHGYTEFTYLSKKNAGVFPISLTFTYKRAEAILNGVALKDYTVVYAQEGVGGDKNIQAAKYADTAKEFVKLFEKATGTTLKVVSDTEKNLGKDRLILFGNTALSDDNSVYSYKFVRTGIDIYCAKQLENGNIALAGNNACSAFAAGEAMIYSLIEKNGRLDSLDLSGEKDLIRVACVGDSITYGTNSSDPSMQSYPVYLQRMLGYRYYVEKYGAPSHSLIETDTPSFLKHNYFKQSAAMKPDVVIVMLGTNDCRTQKWEDSAYKNWNDPARKEAFLASGQKLVDAYRNAKANVQIIFATCPTVPQDEWLNTDWTSRIRRYGNPAICTVAETNNCPVIDIYTYSTKHPEMFEGGDGLHPQNEQYEILAKGVYELSKDIIKK